MKPTALTKDQNEILDLRDRVYELEDEVAKLQKALAKVCAARAGRLPGEWKLRLSEENILLALAKAESALPANVLTVVLTKARTDNGVRVHLHNMKRKLSDIGITVHTERGNGYYLSPEDKAKVLAVMIQPLPEPSQVAA